LAAFYDRQRLPLRDGQFPTGDVSKLSAGVAMLANAPETA
jgi:hypothetical protein